MSRSLVVQDSLGMTIGMETNTAIERFLDSIEGPPTCVIDKRCDALDVEIH